MGQIKAVITDFDGTLVDTIIANYFAYSEAFAACGLELDRNLYQNNYGLRFDDLCKKIGIEDNEIKQKIRSLKANIYPKFFSYIRINNKLLTFIQMCKDNGIKTCIASTAAKKNLYGVLKHFYLDSYFDIIISGDDVSKGKPSPEVYIKALDLLDCEPEETLVFEDSKVGCEAAEAAGIQYIKVNGITQNIMIKN